MTASFQPFVRRAADGQPLTFEEMGEAMALMFDGRATAVQIAAFLTALKMRGETITEIAAAASAMRAKATRFAGPANAIDTCGTGGDGANTYNVSTAVAFVLAGCGLPVAKHGNKAASSMSGAADILSELGVNILAGPEIAHRALDDIGICFLFAQMHHPAMKHVAPVRAEMGIRTLFNLLGPLTNPAGAPYQLLGVFDPALTEPIAGALGQLGSRAAWVVHGSDGLDELTTTGPSRVTALADDGEIRTFDITPDEAGLPLARSSDLTGGSPAENAAALRALLTGTPGAYRDIVVLNAAAGLVVAGKAETLREGALLAGAAIDDGRARDKLDSLIRITQTQD